MKVSVIIPHWPLNEELDMLLDRCVATLRGYDELLVIVNDGIGFGPAVNRGLRLAHGDFLLVVNNDTAVLSGDLTDLCDRTAVTVPKIDGQVDQLPRAFFCMPRWVYEDVGGYDERFHMGYFEDDDLIKRLDIHGVPIRTVDRVQVSHLGGTTMRQIESYDDIFRENMRRYQQKWPN